MVADDQGRAVALIDAVEGLPQAVAHLVAPVGVLGGVALRGRPRLVDHVVVVHAQRVEGAARHGNQLERDVPEPVRLLGPDLLADPAGVVAEAHALRRQHEVLLAFEAGGAGADELLVVVEGERLLLLQARVGLPVLDEGLGLVDLALPLVHGPGADAAVGPAEVPVEVGADLVALQPGRADLGGGVLDALEVSESDVGAAGRVLRSGVEETLLLGKHVHAAEEVRHPGVVLLAHVTEVREELLAVLAGPVPREHDELRGLLPRLQLLRLLHVRLRSGVRGRTVADGAIDTSGGLGSTLARVRASGGRGLRGFRGGAPGDAQDQRRGDQAAGDLLRGGDHPPHLSLAVASQVFRAATSHAVPHEEGMTSRTKCLITLER